MQSLVFILKILSNLTCAIVYNAKRYFRHRALTFSTNLFFDARFIGHGNSCVHTYVFMQVHIQLIICYFLHPCVCEYVIVLRFLTIVFYCNVALVVLTSLSIVAQFFCN